MTLNAITATAASMLKDGDSPEHVRSTLDLSEDELAEAVHHAGLPTPEQLLVELGELHTRAMASPLPQHPAAMGWQMQAAALAALAARALKALNERDTQMATRLAAWYHGPLGEGPHPEDHSYWLEKNVASSPEEFRRWIEEGRQAAAEAKVATEAHEAKRQHRERSPRPSTTS